jgi:general secretion pathway protein K
MSKCRRRGVALPLVLWLLVILGAVATGVAVEARSTTELAGNVRARLIARNASESGVAMAKAEIEERLAAFADSGQGRRAYLNQLDAALSDRGEITLGDGRVQVVLVDVNARLDVNSATAKQLTRLFELFAGPAEAADAAAAIRHWMGADDDTQPRMIDTVARIALRPTVARPIRSLEEMRRIPGLSDGLLRAAAPYLTVDGDGAINRATASDTVLRIAGGELRDEPTRILIVSRGWRDGHPLTHEIQAVYAIAQQELALVRWRERGL